MRLRYAGRCRLCAADLPAGETAVYERSSNSVRCVSCLATADGTLATAAEPGAAIDDSQIFAGTAGASARREFERRKGARDTRIRDAHPLVGGLLLALSDEPQSTRAWAIGAVGEERLGQRLDGLVRPGIHALHDRRIPRSRANIDHLVVCSSGVFVIDAKRYDGRPTLRVEGGLIRPRTESLFIGSRNKTALVDGVHKQIGYVRSALDAAGFDDVAIRGMLCFVDADWPLFGGDFTVNGVSVLWPKKVADQILRPGNLSVADAQSIYRGLASAFSPAG